MSTKNIEGSVLDRGSALEAENIKASEQMGDQLPTTREEAAAEIHSVFAGSELVTREAISTSLDNLAKRGSERADILAAEEQSREYQELVTTLQKNTGDQFSNSLDVSLSTDASVSKEEEEMRNVVTTMLSKTTAKSEGQTELDAIAQADERGKNGRDKKGGADKDTLEGGGTTKKKGKDTTGSGAEGGGGDKPPEGKDSPEEPEEDPKKDGPGDEELFNSIHGSRAADHQKRGDEDMMGAEKKKDSNIQGKNNSQRTSFEDFDAQEKPLSFKQKINIFGVKVDEWVGTLPVVGGIARFFGFAPPEGYAFLYEQQQRGILSEKDITNLYGGQKQIDDYDKKCLGLSKDVSSLKATLEQKKKEEVEAEKAYREGRWFARGRYEKIRAQVASLQGQYDMKQTILTQNYNQLTTWKNERTNSVEGFTSKVREYLEPVENKLQIVQGNIKQYVTEINTFESDNKKLKTDIAAAREALRQNADNADEKIAKINEMYEIMKLNEQHIIEAKAAKQKEEQALEPLITQVNGYKDRIAQFERLNHKVLYEHKSRQDRDTPAASNFEYDAPKYESQNGGGEQLKNRTETIEEKAQPIDRWIKEWTQRFGSAIMPITAEQLEARLVKSNKDRVKGGPITFTQFSTAVIDIAQVRIAEAKKRPGVIASVDMKKIQDGLQTLQKIVK